MFSRLCNIGQVAVLGLAICSMSPKAASSQESGRLLATAGVTQIEGAGGGGLTPWATITGYGTRDAIGANVHYTGVLLNRFTLHSSGAAIGLFDRLELSYAHQWLDTGNTGTRLGLGGGYQLQQDIFGAKVRLFGDIVYDQDSLLPQVAIGAEGKVSGNEALVKALGARSSRGVDVYLAATKLFLAQSLLVNGTLRLTQANQFGLLGFGGDKSSGYRPQVEASVALLLSRNFAIGGEVRTKPDNLSFAREGTAFDIFAAYFLSKNISTTVAFVSLGPIARQPGQNGAYLSLQAGF